MVTRDIQLLSEAYVAIREQGPVAAGFQGMAQGVAPYAAGAMAGAKQLGQNLAGAVTGSQQAPQSPVAAGQKAFTQQRVNQAVDAVIKVFGLPAEWRNYVSNQVRNIVDKVSGRENAMNQSNINKALQSTGQSLTPQMNIYPRVSQKTGQLIPGRVTGNQMPVSPAYQRGMSYLDPQPILNPYNQ